MELLGDINWQIANSLASFSGFGAYRCLVIQPSLGCISITFVRTNNTFGITSSCSSFRTLYCYVILSSHHR